MWPRPLSDETLSFAPLDARLTATRRPPGAPPPPGVSRAGQQQRSHRVSRGSAILLGALSLFSPWGCGRSDDRIARRILEDHRTKTASHPLPGSQIIHLALFSNNPAAAGIRKIEWGSQNYRETTSSGGATTVLGIQGGKAYFTDEDGVTRVVSDPVLARLLTRSYFWRRAWLFDDLERARLALGPADAESVSLRISPRGGNLLEIQFARRGLSILSVRSPGFELRFDGKTPSKWVETSAGKASVRVEHRSTGLPTGDLRDAEIGGWSSIWKAPAADAPLVPVPSEAAAVRGSVAGTDLVIALDGAIDGPLRVRPAVASRLGWQPAPDVFGRRLVPGVRVAIGAWSQPSDFAEVSDEVPAGADAAIGGGVFREVIAEYAADKGRLTLHDPEKWVRPEGYYRCILDDDGNRPVGILTSVAETLRVVAGVTQPHPLVLSEESARRAGFPAESRLAEKLRWGPAQLPPLEMERRISGLDPGSGDDGRLSAAFLLRFRAVLDLTHRWAYLKPEGAAPPKGD